MLKGFKEVPVSGGDSLCRMVILLKLRGLKEAPMSRVGPCAAERRPCAAERMPCAAERRTSVPRGGPLCWKVLCAERIGGGPCVRRRPLCREEVLYAGRFYVLRELE